MESLLKKEFKESDIQRARNLISGNYGRGTKNQVGYSKKEEFHKEGDVWEENGKEWTIEDGIKVSVSKLQKARKALQMPYLCPRCGKRMNTRLDKKMYPIHGMCFDCVVRMEDDLKRAGLYEDYEKYIMSGNIKSFVEDFRARITDMAKEQEIKISTEEGTVENWGKVSSEVIRHLQEWADILTEKID